MSRPGRPALPKGVRKEQHCIRIRPDVIEWLRNRPEGSGPSIESMVDFMQAAGPGIYNLDVDAAHWLRSQEDAGAAMSRLIRAAMAEERKFKTIDLG